MSRQISTPRDLPYARHQLIEVWEDTPDLMTREVAAGLRYGTCYWVTPDMTAVAGDAAMDLPKWSAATAAPSPSGLLVWRGQLPEHDLQGFVTMPTLGVVWAPVTDGIGVTILTDSSRMSEALRGEFGRAINLHPSDIPSLPALCPTATWVLPRHEAARPIGKPGRDYTQDSVGITALIGATWTLMQQPMAIATHPRVARRDIQIADHVGASRPLVTAVDLRPMRSQDHYSDHAPDDQRRRVSVRHIVRGHWRQQYYPSDHSHRPRWIESHIRGPADAPLHITEQVLVWRR